MRVMSVIIMSDNVFPFSEHKICDTDKIGHYGHYLHAGGLSVNDYVSF